MVQAQYRLVTEGLGVRHLRLIIGNSMGGMQTWMWGQTWPQMMDALVPMASQPTEMSSRNWMMRRLLIESIKQDPAWNHGNYSEQPPSLSADDERNPPETGLLEASMKELKQARLLLIPASADTRGHGTTSMAKFYSKELGQFMQQTEKTH